MAFFRSIFYSTTPAAAATATVSLKKTTLLCIIIVVLLACNKSWRSVLLLLCVRIWLFWKGKIMVSFCISTCKWCLKMSLLIIPHITMTWVDAVLFLQQKSMQCYEFRANGTWPERASILPVDDYYSSWEQDGTSLFLQWWLCCGRNCEISTQNNNILIDNTE